ncbi:MAG: phosphoglucosamine mutase [Holosporales bacterium]|jgi:phosphoglucosamine mutase|nr:phosphoglucosamine mutase [Holosporales bacterium]
MQISSNIFGTDGIRGLTNSGYITPEHVTNLALAAATYFDSKSENFTIVIGKDTRLSGYMLESALTAGFVSAGANVMLLGPIPTPAISMLTRSMRANLGVVISASHNPYQDNGIKFFNSSGFKLSISDEQAITDIFFRKNFKLASPEKLGKAKRIDDIDGRYVEFVKSSFKRNLKLFGVKIVIDSANGAAYKVAPEIFWELGAEIIMVGNSPDGLNINAQCGATNTELLQKKVKENNADIGFALDGDADRLIIVDNNGEILDGDYILAVIATDWKNRGVLKGDNIVATKLSNTGLARYLESLGLHLETCDVGDRHVLETMFKKGANLGGEKSGHIVMTDYTTTGDGMIAALQVLNYLVSNNKRSSEIKNLYKPYPQKFKNIYSEVDPNVENIVKKISQNILQERGRIIIRKSGTEDLTRIMIEAEDQKLIDNSMDLLEPFC